MSLCLRITSVTTNFVSPSNAGAWTQNCVSLSYRHQIRTETLHQCKVKHNTGNSKACPFTVANLGVFQTVFQPIRMKTSDFGGREPGFAVQMLPASPAIGVWLLPKEGNQQVRVMDCGRAILERLDCFVPSLQLLVYILNQVGGPRKTWNVMMHHQLIPSTSQKPHCLAMSNPWIARIAL